MRAMKWAACLAVLLTCAGSAQAAFIHWDDTDVNTITVTWSGFDLGGFSVGGGPDTADGTVTLADGAYHFQGIWIAPNEFSAFETVHFYLPGDPGGLTSGTEFTASGLDAALPDFFPALIVGDFYGFTGSSYGPGAVLALQDGHTEFFSAPGLTMEFTSEAPPRRRRARTRHADAGRPGCVRPGRRSDPPPPATLRTAHEVSGPLPSVS